MLTQSTKVRSRLPVAWDPANLTLVGAAIGEGRLYACKSRVQKARVELRERQQSQAASSRDAIDRPAPTKTGNGR